LRSEEGLRARREERENAGENFDRSARSRARQLKYMGDWLYSKRPSENIETKCKSTRKAEHRGKGVERRDERYWEAEGTKAMVRTRGTEHRTRRQDRKGNAGPQRPVI